MEKNVNYKKGFKDAFRVYKVKKMNNKELRNFFNCCKSNIFHTSNTSYIFGLLRAIDREIYSRENDGSYDGYSENLYR